MLLRNIYQNYVPIILEKYNINDPALTHNKYLMPNNLSFYILLNEVKKRLLNKDFSDVSISFYVKKSNDKMIHVPLYSIINLIYNQYKNSDGYLHLTYTTEIILMDLSTDF